jgi:hypothetical protein
MSVKFVIRHFLSKESLRSTTEYIQERNLMCAKYAGKDFRNHKSSKDITILTLGKSLMNVRYVRKGSPNRENLKFIIAIIQERSRTCAVFVIKDSQSLRS